ncbi:MAG: FRG domain-containing protein [Sulfuritalea sp.]|jgi:hypothetical protein|nr:FRG domain-containing protein [Sulfuritalea sp.]
MRIAVHEMPVEINSVATLMTEVQLLHDSHRAPIWLRGHGDYNWKLQPTVGREQTFLGEKVAFNARQERYLLHQFRRYAYAEWGRKLDEWEGLFLARHHGLPVRIMDWTANPLVALYFAAEFQRLPVVDGAVWAFRRRRDPETPDGHEIDVFEHQDPFAVKGVRMVYPFYNAQRMIGQKGAFTIHGNPGAALEDPIAHNRVTAKHIDVLALHRWRVPSAGRAAIGKELEHMDVNKRRLFPDLDGLAAGLVNAEILKRVAGKYET